MEGGEVGAQVAPPILLHQSLPGRLHESPHLARKRDLGWQHPYGDHSQHQIPQHMMTKSGYPSVGSTWTCKMWNWDSSKFVAKPTLECGNCEFPEEQRRNGKEDSRGGNALGEDNEGLALKLGGSYYMPPPPTEELVTRPPPSKRVRSGSPGNGANCPMCQVDDCKTDLSTAKDYHRRHKVCETHSKTTQAFVGKQLQRFCQQCSRFHLLSEFDEGKRSCRRRLAGHNRRRRKVQAEDASSRVLLPGSQDNNGNVSKDIFNLLSALAHFQGNNLEKAVNSSALLDKTQLVQLLLSKINPSPSANKKVPEDFDLNVPQTPETSDQLSKASGGAPASSNMDFLSILSAAVKASDPKTSTSQSQGSSGCSDDDKTRHNVSEPTTDANSRNHNQVATFPSTGGVSSDRAVQSALGVVEHHIQLTKPKLPLQLFGSGDDSPPKLGSSRKYMSSESSNPMEEGSPSSSPPVAQKLFPLHSGAESLNNKSTEIFAANTAMVEMNTSHEWNTALHLGKDSRRRAENKVVQNSPLRAGGYVSSSSDHSPSSSNSDAHDRTGRIIVKLFDKDPRDFPRTIKSQILNWLSHIPTEMESYIRPGCVFLSIYLSMPSSAWEEFQDHLLHRIHLLLQCADSDFWRNGRFLICTDSQLASHKDGKIRLCRNWKAWGSPELKLVSPIAVVNGKETRLLLKGRNLTIPGTKIHCTYMGGYTTKDVLGSAYPGTMYDDSSSESFNFHGETPDAFGRCFIEVENGFKGNSFPIIVADKSICQELSDLESELEAAVNPDALLDDQPQEQRKTMSREDIIHFLNELGWLFQRKNMGTANDFSCSRFKFLLTFAVEKDWPSLVRKVLDIFAERSYGSDELINESLEALAEVHLLNQAVKRNCRKMVELLLHYSVDAGSGTTKWFLFLPNLAGPGGVTPLHLAASMQEAEDIVDALTSDPQEIGMNSWSSVLDDNGQTPYAYASERNHNSYNRLVARKLADKKNGQVSVIIENGDASLDKSWIVKELDGVKQVRDSVKSTCNKCAFLESRRLRGNIHTQGLLHRPFIHSMLAIAAVCVCVCLFFRGAPKLSNVTPFKWENVDFGPR